MFALVLVACTTPSPPLDVRGALEGSCGLSIQSSEEFAVFEGPAPSFAVRVTLRSELTLDGAAVEPSQLLERMSEKAVVARALAARMGDAEGFQGELLVELAPDTPARDFVPVLDAAMASDFREIRFLGRSATRRVLPPFADAEFGEELMTTRQGPIATRHSRYEAILGDLPKACPALDEALATVGAMSAEARCEGLIGTLEAVLPTCPAADRARILTSFQVSVGREETVLTVLPVRLDPDADAFDIAPTDTWASVVPRLQAAGPTVRFALETD